MQFKRSKVAAIAAAVSIALAVGVTSSASAAVKPIAKGSLKGVSITVGSKDFTESIILSKIVKQLVLAGGGKVSDKTNIKGSVTTRTAMLKGNINLYWEYTGTAWLNYLKQSGTNFTPMALYSKVVAKDKANGVVWLPMTSFNDTYAFAITKANAAKYGINKVSDFAKAPADAKWCIESEFQGRPDGWAGFKSAYGITTTDATTSVLDTGAIYEATKQGQCFFGEVFATDGRIGALGLKVVNDDKNYFPAYNAAITTTSAIAKKYPSLIKALTPLAGLISNATMQTLNARIDVLGEDADDVAKSWLSQVGLVK